MMSFDDMVKTILERGKVSRDELMSKIRQKQEELSGFITSEGAAIIVGRELGVEFGRKEPEVRELTIDDLTAGMSGVDIVGRIIRVYEPRNFKRVDGSLGKVGSVMIQDQTGQVRAVLWDDKVSLLEEGKINKGAAIQIRGGYVKSGIDQKPEVNIGTRGFLIIEPDDPRVQNLPPLMEAKVRICDLNPALGEVDIVGRVAVVSEPRTFDRPGREGGKVSTIMLMDGTGYARVSLWDGKAELVQNIKRGDIVKLENASVRRGLRDRAELHVGSRGRLVLNPPEAAAAELPPLVEKPLKIEQIETDMQTLDLIARVRRKFNVYEFKRDDGSAGKVMSVILADETGTVRTSFWGNAVELAKKFSIGDIVSIHNAYTRTGLASKPEVQIGRSTSIEINPAGISVGELKPSRIKIGELEVGMDALEVIGRVIEVSRAREFTRTDGSKGKVATLGIGDETGTARLSLWQDAVDKAEKIKVGDIIKATNCYGALGLYGQPELHLGRQGSIDVNPSIEEELPRADVLSMAIAAPERVSIGALEKEGLKVQVRGTIVRVFQRRPLFDVCPLCGRSLGSIDHSLLCEECGKVVTPEHRVVVSFLVEDGTGNIRAVLFGKVAEKLLGMDAQHVFELFKQTPDIVELYNKLSILGKEVTITGITRYDKYFNQLEIRASDVEIPEPKQEARVLLEKIKA
jgi:replication factor A1